MPTNSHKNELFQNDRRQTERPIDTNRRRFLRPSRRLRLRGILVAAVVAAILIAAAFLFWQ